VVATATVQSTYNRL